MRALVGAYLLSSAASGVPSTKQNDMKSWKLVGSRCVSSKPLVRITCKFKRIFQLNDLGMFVAMKI